MTSFPKSKRYQLSPVLPHRLQLATIFIIRYAKTCLSPKLFAAIGAFGGKTRYIRTVQHPAFVQAGGNTSILGIIWQKKLDYQNAGRTVATDYSLAVSRADNSRYCATNVI